MPQVSPFACNAGGVYPTTRNPRALTGTAISNLDYSVVPTVALKRPTRIR